MRRSRLYIVLGIFVIVLGAGFFVNLKFSKKPVENPTPSPSITAVASPTNTPETSVPTPETTLPNSYLIKNVPFQPQAPFAVWDQLHDEACEEAAVILTYYYLKGKSLSAAFMDEQILKMVDWQIQNWGSHKDLTIAKTAEMAKEFYGLEGKTYYDITIEDIKRKVSQDQPVIVPTAGRLLGNPYYRQPGPIYHMLVVIGWEGKNIIVQDIGTKRGDHYEYNEKIFFNAIHDWAGSPENIEEGQKGMLAVF